MFFVDNIYTPFLKECQCCGRLRMHQYQKYFHITEFNLTWELFMDQNSDYYYYLDMPHMTFELFLMQCFKTLDKNNK